MKLTKLLFIAMAAGTMLSNCTQKPVEPKTCGGLNAENFKTVINGKQTGLYILQNGDICAAITNYGGRIVSLMVPDKNGALDDVVLGFSSIDGYLNAHEVFHGALIGRVGNRIAKGNCTLNGEEYKSPSNVCPL